MTLTTYTGSCHCGAVRFEADLDLSEGKQVVSCNCSICSRAGWLLAFTGEEGFRLLSGEQATTDYQFAKKHIHHLFCTTCGVRSYGWGNAQDGKKMYSINVRCLEGVDPAKLSVQHYDGRSL
jgi:hypothetical protein